MATDRQPSDLQTLADLVSSLRDEVRALRTEVEALKAGRPAGEPSDAFSVPDTSGDTAIADRPAQRTTPKPPSGTLAPNSYEIVFDGGSLGNPGKGYGSYILFGPGEVLEKRKLDYADRGPAVTNNQAEYLTLIRAVERLQERLGPKARTASLSIWGDSNLVVSQITGVWKVKNADLMPLVQEARAALGQFGNWSIRWHERGKSVRYLGH